MGEAPHRTNGIPAAAGDGPYVRPRPPYYIRRVRIRNFKSIAECDVELQPFTLLVGRNGSGKSNFLDALDCLIDVAKSGLSVPTGLTDLGWHAGNLKTVGAEGPMELHAEITSSSGQGSFEVALIESEDDSEHFFEGFKEHTLLSWARSGNLLACGSENFFFPDGRLANMPGEFAKLLEDGRKHVFNVRLGHDPDHFRVRSVAMGWSLLAANAYRIWPPGIRRSSSGSFSAYKLINNGENLASILRVMANSSLPLFSRVRDFLTAIVPGLCRISVDTDAAARDLLNFEFNGVAAPLTPNDVSDGTILALAKLTAALQRDSKGRRPTFVAIEEPEDGVHPGAASVLVDALTEAAETTQILASTHSADLLAHPDIKPEMILAFEMVDGCTRVGPIDDVSAGAARDGLYDLGEMLRMNQLRPAGVR